MRSFDDAPMEPKRLNERQKALAEENWHRVAKVAGKRAKRLPRFIRLDDLISYGALGLIDAAHRNDDSKGLKFTTYANWRINGAISDGIRETRNKAKRAMLNDMLSIEGEELVLRSDDRLSPESEVIREDIIRLVREAVDALPPLERKVLILTEWKGVSQPEVAKRLGYCEEWIYQIRRKAKATLRIELADCV